MTTDALLTCRGGCHCGEVAFEIDVPPAVTAQQCNCSICSMTGFLHLIVPAARFRLLSGSDRLVSYQFNTGVARHLFCGRCGVKSFYVPRSNPDGYSINVHCLADSELVVEVEPFDGRDWEAHGPGLAGLSRT